MRIEYIEWGQETYLQLTRPGVHAVWETAHAKTDGYKFLTDGIQGERVNKVSDTQLSFFFSKKFSSSFNLIYIKKYEPVQIFFTWPASASTCDI